jgi:hypothetical protein
VDWSDQIPYAHNITQETEGDGISIDKINDSMTDKDLIPRVRARKQVMMRALDRRA